MNLTRLALKHGCDIEEAVPYNDFYFNALSDVNSRSWSQVYPSSPIEILDFLLNIGYDLEQRSSDGLTALLHASCQHMPHIIKCLRLFIKRGADLHTTDFEGKGALHCALAAPDIYDEWYGTLNDVWWSDSENVIDNANWTARFRFNTEDDRHEEDYEDEGIDPGPLLDDIINNSYHYADGAANEYDIDYIFCEDDDGVRHMIHDPMQVLKKRTRFKLLTLLQLGCDPNVVDHEGLSPSDYAMERGLLPQWRWALLNAGYVHHEQNGWVKSSLLD